jgi:hypothetical protein
VKRATVALGRRYTSRRLLPVLGSQHEELLDLGDGFVVWAVPLLGDPERAPRSLRELDQALAGAKLLGVHRAGGEAFVGAPPTDLELHVDDALVLYGTRDALRELATNGDAAD